MRIVPVLLLALFVVSLARSESGIAGDVDTQLFKIGSVDVWRITDVTGEMDVGAIFPGDPETIRRYVPSGKTQQTIFAFLYHIGGEWILADTGLGSTSGARVSRLLQGLETVGVSPERIDAVVITHMHGDHIGGLLKDGGRAFPNARLKLGRIEHDFWTALENREKFPGREANFDMAMRVVDAYRGRLDLLEFGDSIVPGLVAQEAIGHTPGHTALYLESDGERLLCVADLIHATQLQFPRPDMSPRYDMDPETAQRARERILHRAARENIPISGMHLAMPGVGRVKEVGTGVFEFVPGL